MVGTAVLAFCYTYLYLEDKQKYLKIWALSWAVYLGRYIFMLAYLLWRQPPSLLIANQISSLISGVLLLYGSYLFLERKFPPLILYASVLDGVWIVISVVNNLSFMVMALPTFFFLAFIYIWTGFIFLRHARYQSKEAAIVGGGFIVWGIHKANYPFLRPIEWFAPWGYLLGAILEFITALGLLLVYFRKTKDDLLHSQKRMMDAQRIAKVGDWSWELDQNRLVWSDETYRIFGQNPGHFAVTIDAFEKSIHPEDYKRFIQERNAALEENRGIDIEHRIVLPGNRIRWVHELSSVTVDENRKAIKAAGTVQDITDRKNAERKLKTSENKFAKAFGNAPLLMSISSLEDGRYLDINETFIRVTGFTRETALGRTSVEMGHISEHDRDHILTALELNGRVFELELELTKADGSRLICLYSGEIINFEGKDRLLSIAIDITERKTMEKTIQESQRMESIGNLAGGIAHDFNNILFPIVGISEMLLEELPAENPMHGNVREILKAGQRGSDLVRQILAFSRRSQQKMLPTRIQHILSEAVKLCRSTIPAFIEIREDIHPGCGPVLADPTQIHQVVMNIITNAYHATEIEGGKIAIELREKEVDEGSKLTELEPRPGRYALLSVSDTGHGIPADLRGKIFDPYFTTKEQGKGTGLGLAVVYGIIQAHEGYIDVNSEIGKGTTFNIYLPLIGDSSEQEPDVEQKEQNDYTGNETILLVDDEKQIAQMGKTMLERLGYTVKVRTGSMEALETFRKDPGAFDLVITDMNMPSMTGATLADELMALRPGIPVILCTGYSERINKELSEAAGINAFLLKPIKKSVLARTVRKVLDEAQ